MAARGAGCEAAACGAGPPCVPPAEPPPSAFEGCAYPRSAFEAAGTGAATPIGWGGPDEAEALKRKLSLSGQEGQELDRLAGQRPSNSLQRAKKR